MASPLPPADQTAYDVMLDMLRQWGLESLAPDVLRLLQDGRTLDQVSSLLQDTEAYQQRFQGNQIRRQQGAAVLSPREYLATEASYRQIMESAGLPVGFYDSPDDFAQWIGNDVSPSEIRSRVDYATDAAQRLDDGTKRAFQDYYGIQPTDLAAFFLDRQRALPQLQQIARGAQIGGAGFGQGLAIDRQRAEQLALSKLVSDADINPAIGRVSTLEQNIGKLGSLYGDTYGETEAENEVFFGDYGAQVKRKRLTQREQAEFGGTSGVSKGSLAQPLASY